MTMKRTWIVIGRRSRVAALCGIALLLAATAPAGAVAAEVTWSSTGTATLWSSTLNWRSATVPPLPTASDDALFGAAFGTPAVTLDVSSTIRSLRISTTSAFVLAPTNASTLTLVTGSVSRSAVSSGTQTLAAPMVLGASGVWAIDGGGALVMSGGVSSGTNLFGITKTGTGTLVLSGSNSYTGPTSVASGCLLYTSPSPRD